MRRSRPLSAIVAGYKKKLETVARESSADALQSVKDLSPVSTGQLRDSWQPSQPTHTIVIGDKLTVVSDVWYARIVEYGFGPGPGGGMVRLTVMQWQQIVDRAARRVR